MSTYSEDDIKTVKWDEGVLKRREMYFGDKTVDGVDIGESIKFPAVTLGAKNTKILELGEWFYFCSDIDWLFLSELEVAEVNRVFNRPLPFPEGGVNSFRTESLCLPFSTDAFTIAGNDKVLLKGVFPQEEEFKEHVREIGEWGRIVGFKFDKNA